MSLKTQNLQKQLKLMRESKRKTYRDFNGDLTRIVVMAYNKDRRNPTFIEINNKFSIYRSTFEDKPILDVGPRLWQYKNEITNRDEIFFLGDDFLEYINNQGNSSDFNIQILTQTLKQLYLSLTDPEKNILWKYIGSLLSLYAQYSKIDRSIRTLTETIKTRI